MPSGLLICALRASGRPTEDSGYTGWPTPQAFDSTGVERSEEAKKKAMAGRAIEGRNGGAPCNLRETAQLAGWVSPTAQDHSRGCLPPRPQDTGVPLSQQAALAGWATPDANAMNLGEGLDTWDRRQVKNKAKHHNGNGAGMPIAIQAQTVLSGPTPTSSPAATENRGALASEFSGWLMGFNVLWELAGRVAMLKLLKPKTKRKK
jgi:hypothetical protein